LGKVLLLYSVGLASAALAATFPSLAWLSPLAFMLLLPAGAIWIWRTSSRPFSDLGLRVSSDWVRLCGVGIIIGLAIPLLFIGLQAAAGWTGLSLRPDSLPAFLPYFFTTLIKMLLIVAVEEFVFRGLFLTSLSRRYGFAVAVFLSSLLWGLGHLVSMVSAGLSPLFILTGMTTFVIWGTFLCMARRQADGFLWLPYGIHLGNNLAFSLIGWFVIIKYQAPPWWVGYPSWAPESGLVGIVGWLILVGAIYWFSCCRASPGELS
jgi:membrane protease YdiL (CAAX protease family)